MMNHFSKPIKVCLGCLIIPIILFIAIYLLSFLMGPPELLDPHPTTFLSNDFEIIYEIKDPMHQTWVSLEEISPHVLDSALVIEDQNFFNHRGFDLKGIIRAAYVNLKSLSLKEGASTITQQYARNLFLTHEKTWIRKLKEAFYTIRLEMHYSKDEILEGYLNTIYFGHGAYGIHEASQYFFNKTAKDLTVSEASLLMAIPKGPTYYSPLNNFENAKSRQKNILQKLLEHEKIREDVFERALQEQFVFHRKQTAKEDLFGAYFFDATLKEAESILNLDQESIQSGGYVIYTTMNEKFQRSLEEMIDEHFEKNHDLQVASMAIDPQTGAVYALVGGTNYEESAFNRALSAKRMPGSTFKTLLFYAALERNYTPLTTLLSKPTAFILANDEVYKPQNFNGYYADGPITLAQAIALSDNVYAVKTNLQLGVTTLKETAENFGITSELPAVPSLALGTAVVSLDEMVKAYGMLANGGREINRHFILKITDRNGKLLYKRPKEKRTQKLDPINTFLLTHLLTGMFDENLNGYMEVTGASVADQLTREYAGKSGSTPYDSWMIGYSPYLVSGLWTGFDDHRKIERAQDRSKAKEIWAQFMEKAHKDYPRESFPIPKGVVRVPIDPITGKISTPYCPRSREMYFLKGTEPTEYCDVHFSDSKGQPKQTEEENGFFQKLFDLFFTISFSTEKK